MSVLGYVECRVSLEEKHLKLGVDCVGAILPFVYKRRSYEIHFPNFDSTNMDKFGHPVATRKGTKIGLNWLDHPSEDREYGSELRRTAAGFSSNTIIVRSKKSVTAEEARKMKQELTEWHGVFTSWFEVLNFTDLEFGGVSVEQAKTVAAYFLPVSNDTFRRIKKKNEGGVSIIAHITEEFGLKQLRRALRFAASGNQVPAYYTQIISALRHHNNCQYRQSLLDTATATELAMTELLDVKLTGHSASQRHKLIKQYRMLSGLELGLTTLGVSVPPDIKSKIAQPRNGAMHRGVIVTATESREALYTAKAFIYQKLPI